MRESGEEREKKSLDHSFPHMRVRFWTEEERDRSCLPLKEEQKERERAKEISNADISFCSNY